MASFYADLGDCSWCGAPAGQHLPLCPEYDPPEQREQPDDMGQCLCGHGEENHLLNACLTCTCLRYTPDE